MSSHQQESCEPEPVQTIFQMQMDLLNLHTKIFSASPASYHFSMEYQYAIKIEGF